MIGYLPQPRVNTHITSNSRAPHHSISQDMVAMQELILQIRPDLIIETGIAHGGSLIMNASMLGMLDLCDAIESGDTIDPARSKRKVLGIDIVYVHTTARRLRHIRWLPVFR